MEEHSGQQHGKDQTTWGIKDYRNKVDFFSSTGVRYKRIYSGYISDYQLCYMIGISP